jgi:seryl-tRNA(Sec) selenium transferase
MEQRLERQTEEMTRAAREMTKAARELRRAVERLAELQARPVEGSALAELLGSGELPEEEFAALALRVTHDVREDVHREREAAEGKLPTPSSEEIREWERRREERRGREGYHQPG